MKQKFFVMDHSGDSRHSFDTTDPVQQLEAERMFNEFLKQGYTPATRSPESEGGATVTRKYDPTAKEMVFYPRLQGG